MAGDMDLKKEEKKEQIMQVAFQTIQKYGIRRITLDDIARASGMAITSIYYYFPSKNALITATLSQFSNAILKKLDVVVKSKQPPEEKLVASWEIIFSSIKESGFLLNMDRKTMNQMISLAEDVVSQFEAQYQKLIKKILLEGKKSGVFHVVDVDLWALLLSIGVTSLIENEKTQKQILQDANVIEKMSTLLLKGLLTR